MLRLDSEQMLGIAAMIRSEADVIKELVIPNNKEIGEAKLRAIYIMAVIIWRRVDSTAHMLTSDVFFDAVGSPEKLRPRVVKKESDND